MLVAIEVEVGVAPVIDRQEAWRVERGDPLPVTRCPRVCETVHGPRRRVLDARGPRHGGRFFGAALAELVEARERRGFALDVKQLPARDEAIRPKGPESEVGPLESTPAGAVGAEDHRAREERI